MNIDGIELGDLKQVFEMFGAAPASFNFYEDIVGKFVIVRSRSAGVNAGIVVAADPSGIVLKRVRRLWYHVPAEKSESWYEGVALYGLGNDSKISATVPQKGIIEDYEWTLCSPEAEKSIKNAPSHAQS